MELVNIPLRVADNELLWKTIKTNNGWKLQVNKITGHSRILNSESVRISWGNYDTMQSLYDHIQKPWKGCHKGDIVAVNRLGGTYAHYAVYIGYGKVIHYAQEVRDGKTAKCCVHKADFSEFLKTETRYELLHFPENGEDPVHEQVDLYGKGNNIQDYEYVLFPELKAALRRIKGYHLYSASETVERAKSRIGEDKYNLAFNNCEHFALWCKTGVKESSQVENFWKIFWRNEKRIIQAM